MTANAVECILVVDDSAADREMAGHLLARQSWSVLYAENGRQALDRMQEHAVDLVLTDLVMPDLDGLAFVEQAKIDHPLVPVVLMTARGSEEIAVRALEAGASSYVPKKGLVRDLVDIVQRILDASRERKSYTRLLGRLRNASFVLENDLELISSLVSYLTQVLRDSGMFEESECQRISSALDEALTNAYYHGNLEVRSDIREHDARAYRRLSRSNAGTSPPYRDRRILVSLNLTLRRGALRHRGRRPGIRSRRGSGSDAAREPRAAERPGHLPDEDLPGRGAVQRRRQSGDVAETAPGAGSKGLRAAAAGSPLATSERADHDDGLVVSGVRSVALEIQGGMTDVPGQLGRRAVEVFAHHAAHAGQIEEPLRVVLGLGDPRRCR